MRIWILFVCLFVAGVKAQSDEAAFADDWYEDYNSRWYDEELKKLGILSSEEDAPKEDTINDNIDTAEVQEKSQEEMDKKVEEEIQQFQESKLNYDDYQYEDNRLKQVETLDDDKDPGETADLIRDVDDVDSASKNDDDYDDYGIFGDFADDVPEDTQAKGDDILVSKDDDIVPLAVPFKSSDEMRDILEASLNKEEQKPNEFETYASDELKEIMENIKNSQEKEQKNAVDFTSDEFKEIMEETKAILEEEEQNPNDFVNESGNEKEINEEQSDLADIIEESKKILEETNMLFDEEADKAKVNEKSAEESPIENIDDPIEKQIDENLSDNIINEEDDEDTVDKVYEDLNEDLDTLFETLNKLANSVDENDKVEPVNVDYAVDSDESLGDDGDYENIFDSNLSDLFAEHSRAEDEKLEKEVEELAKDELTDDKLVEADVDSSKDMEPQVIYGDDGLVSDDEKDESVKKVRLDDLSSAQLDKMMDEFAIQHSDAFNIQASSDHEVKEITLKYGDTEVIQSENFPAAYPVNKIVDWVITGEGQGIEINVTDFDVNAAQEHYLLVKPGQVDKSGPDGLIFTYHLNEPRAYRFTDVDRIFIRFNAEGGFSFFRGFSMTVKMIAPLPSDPEPEPEAEPVLPEPRTTMSLLLGGLTLREFKEVREDFRLLIADMATMYINANGIDPGMNTTAEITQITSSSMCNVHWPGYELCAHVKVSVPLVYEDEDAEERLNEHDLQAMWNAYVETDPFASRLSQMGIEEFTAPNDGGVLTVWLVVALGVVVSAAMLAFALWRYSCLEDYSRMPAFSDTDSVNEKRGLDLYPTPHQTLPPLYSESEYKWDNDSTRVDMGGYANRSYVRTDIYDLDSEEEIPVARDSNSSVKPRDNLV